MLSLTSFYFQDELKKGNNNKSQLIIGENSNLSGQDQSAMTKLTTVSPHFVSMITYIKISQSYHACGTGRDKWSSEVWQCHASVVRFSTFRIGSDLHSINCM